MIKSRFIKALSDDGAPGIHNMHWLVHRREKISYKDRFLQDYIFFVNLEEYEVNSYQVEAHGLDDDDEDMDL